MRRRLILLMIPALFLIAAPTVKEKSTDKPQPVKHKVLKHGNFTPFSINLDMKDPKNYPILKVYENKNDFAKGWRKVLAENPEKVPEVNFSTGRAVIAVSRPRSDSHSDFKLLGVFETKKGVKLEIQATRKEGIGLTIVTAPRFWVLEIPRGDQKVYMEEVKEE